MNMYGGPPTTCPAKNNGNEAILAWPRDQMEHHVQGVFASRSSRRREDEEGI